MNILFIAFMPIVPYVGGVQRVTDALSRELMRQGHKAVFLCYKYKPDLSLPVYACDQLYIEPNGRSDDEVGGELAAIVAKYGVTHVVCQTCDDSSNRIVSLLPQPLRSKVVYVYHIIPFYYMRYTRREIAGFPTHNWRQRLFKAASMVCPAVHRNFFRYHEEKTMRRGLQLAARFCFISDHFYKNVLEVIPDAPQEKFAAINDPNSYPAQQGLAPYAGREKAVLWVGRVENSQKNIFGFLRMWKRFVRMCPEWKAFVVGTGGDLEAAKAMAANGKIPQVSFEGGQSDVRQYFRRCRFFAMTSFWESWGMTLTEAMTCGCIPVAMDTFATLHDIMDHGKSGLICPPSEDAMAQTLAQAAADEAMCEKLAQGAVAKIAKFDVSIIARQWVQLLESL